MSSDHRAVTPCHPAASHPVPASQTGRAGREHIVALQGLGIRTTHMWSFFYISESCCRYHPPWKSVNKHAQHLNDETDATAAPAGTGPVHGAPRLRGLCAWEQRLLSPRAGPGDQTAARGPASSALGAFRHFQVCTVPRSPQLLLRGSQLIAPRRHRGGHAGRRFGLRRGFSAAFAVMLGAW